MTSGKFVIGEVEKQRMINTIITLYYIITHNQIGYKTTLFKSLYFEKIKTIYVRKMGASRNSSSETTLDALSRSLGCLNFAIYAGYLYPVSYTIFHVLINLLYTA